MIKSVSSFGYEYYANRRLLWKTMRYNRFQKINTRSFPAQHFHSEAMTILKLIVYYHQNSTAWLFNPGEPVR